MTDYPQNRYYLVCMQVNGPPLQGFVMQDYAGPRGDQQVTRLRGGGCPAFVLNDYAGPIGSGRSTGLFDIKSSSDFNLFEIERNIEKALKELDRDIPNKVKGHSVDRPKVLYSSVRDFDSTYRGPLLIIVPEMHIYVNGNNLSSSKYGVSPYECKLTNAYLFDKLFRVQDFGIKRALLEGCSLLPKRQMFLKFNEYIQDENESVPSLLEFLSEIMGGNKAVPVERCQDYFGSILSFDLLVWMLNVELDLANHDQSIYDKQTLLNLVESALNLSSEEELKPFLDQQRGLLNIPGVSTEEQLKIYREEAKRFSDLLGSRNFFSCDINSLKPNCNRELYVSLGKGDREKLLDYFSSLIQHMSYIRDQNILSVLDKYNEVLPYLVGARHVPNLISQCQDAKIPCMVIGNEKLLSLAGLNRVGTIIEDNLEAKERAQKEYEKAKRDLMDHTE